MEAIAPLQSDSTKSCAATALSSFDCVLLNAIFTLGKPVVVSNPGVQVLNPLVASPLHELARKWKKAYKLNWHFQDSWAAKLSWDKAVMGVDGKISQVRYKMCIFVERQDKLLVVKIDFLWKHVGRCKALCDTPKVKKGEYYYFGQNQHIRNEQIYYARTSETSIVDKVAARFL